ncbi:LuxR C-terminal-related transcriptional regulator [Streptomyces paradoxus]|uniref:LuxR C-terminal-related transcriptional regulator n=1 Tax=Streptomyces paradoxus TaxID=66375 RepID=UPI0036FF832F
MDDQHVLPVLPVLGSLEIAALRCALTAGAYRVSEIAAELGIGESEASTTMASLEAWGLLRQVAGSEGVTVPATPQAAAAELLRPMQDDVLRRQQVIDQAKAELTALEPLYEQAAEARWHHHALDRLASASVVRSVLNEAADRCSDEVLTVQPGGGRGPDKLQDALTRDLAMLERGAQMRTLYQHTARGSLPTRLHVEQVSEAGALIRTADELPDKMIIFDGELAVLPDRTAVDGNGALLVREPSILAYLIRTFETIWSSAIPFAAEATGYQDASTDLQRTIIRLLAAGAKDEVVARRVGLSVRTCRRHIAEIMEMLGADSRFQAGVLAEKGQLTPQQATPHHEPFSPTPSEAS